MRIRQIKPEFWKHLGLADLKRDVRLLFIGLWCMADCEGRLDDDARLIKAEVFPMDEDITSADINKWLDDLANHPENFITRYVPSNDSVKTRYIEVKRFKDHQQLMGNERGKTSKRPAPPERPQTPVVVEDQPSNDSVMTQYVPSKADIRSNGYTDIRSNGRSPRKISFSDADVETAKFIEAKIQQLDPSFKIKNIDGWANTIRLMVQVDSRSHDGIKELYAWVSRDSFWRKQVLSPDKLRDKWTQLFIAMRNPVQRPQGPQAQHVPSNQIKPAHERQGGSGKIPTS